MSQVLKPMTWDTTASTNTTHTISATARDVAGNNATAASISVTVANPLRAGAIATGVIDANTKFEVQMELSSLKKSTEEKAVIKRRIETETEAFQKRYERLGQQFVN